MKKVLVSGLIAGAVLFVLGYGGLYLAIKFAPEFFLSYNNPLFTSDGSRDSLFYLHAFVISIALSWIWQKLKWLFRGPAIIRALWFGSVYALTALLPVMWITFSSMDITVTMVASWFFYGLFQSIICGLVFSKVNP